MQPSLKEFVDKIFSINPSFSNMFGSGLPGMSGTSITTTGSDSSASNLVNDLRQTTSQFAEQINAQAPRNDIHVLSNKIEGDLLTLQVLGQISDKLCSSLIDDLHSLDSLS